MPYAAANPTASRTLGDPESPLQLVCLRDALLQVFKPTGLNRVFVMHRSLAAALN